MNRLVFAMITASVVLAASGCYTRLTTPKEAREWRVTYPELDADIPVELDNLRGHRGNTFIMTVETYMDIVERYRLYDRTGSPSGFQPHRFRTGSVFEIHLPDHPDDPINTKYYVPNEGTVDIGRLTAFPVAGKTKDELRDDLARALSRDYRSFPEEGGLPTVNVRIPVFEEDSSASRAPFGEVQLLSLGDTGGGGGGGSVALKGEDTVLTVMANFYRPSMDWREIAVRRRIRSTRVDPESGKYFEYFLIVIVDLEKLIFEDPNLDMDMRDGDMIITHAEKNPLIVEILATANAITDAWGSFTGVEGVLEDIFKRNF